MKGKLFWIIGLAVVAIAMVLAVGRARRPVHDRVSTAPEMAWLTDLKLAQERARAESKTIFIDFTGSDWCAPCLILEQQVFSQKEFADYAAAHLILLKVDFPHGGSLSAQQQAANQQLAERFYVQGYPTIIIMGADGQAKGQVELSVVNSPAKVIAATQELIGKS